MEVFFTIRNSLNIGKKKKSKRVVRPVDSFRLFPSFSFWVNVAEEANCNTRSGKSLHSSDDFPSQGRSKV